MGLNSLCDEIKFLLISSRHFCSRSIHYAKQLSPLKVYFGDLFWKKWTWQWSQIDTLTLTHTQAQKKIQTETETQTETDNGTTTVSISVP